MDVYPLKNLQDLQEVFTKCKPIQDTHLGEILLDEDIISRQILNDALREQQKQPHIRLGNILVDMGSTTREEINAALARKFGIPPVSLEDYEIPPEVLSLVPAEVALQYNVLPLAEVSGRLVVAMVNPLDWTALEVLRFNTNHMIEAVLVTHEDIERAFGRYYGAYDETEVLEALELAPGVEAEQQDDNGTSRMEEEASRRPIVRLVNAIILQGVLRGASDIHIRPEKDRVSILYRVDGTLQFSRSINRSLLAPLVSRIKITGQMDIAERRMPQDGHARLVRGKNVIDLRISVMPTVNGESAVIRILDKEVGVKPLDQIGLTPGDYEIVRELISYNHGIFLVTGPTGSGKSTTLYGVLNQVKQRGPHVITVEDPVEYAMEDVEQIQILPAIGYTFAEALRHILRHDPDVIMIGEIRDLETAHIATKAALTGHLVFSTLHTNDAATSVTRLTEMGIEPYLVTATLLGVMAQRLVRKTCPDCKTRETVDDQVRRILGISSDEVFYHGKGCFSCNNTGFKGRTIVCEILRMSPEIAQLVNSGGSAQQIKETATAQGMTTLTSNAIDLARKGVISLEEAFAVRLE